MNIREVIVQGGLENTAGGAKAESGKQGKPDIAFGIHSRREFNKSPKQKKIPRTIKSEAFGNKKRLLLK